MKTQKGQTESKRAESQPAPIIGAAASEASRSIALSEETDDSDYYEPVANMEPVWLDELPEDFAPRKHLWFFTTRREIVIAGGHYVNRRGAAIDDAAALNVNNSKQVRIRFDLSPVLEIDNQSPVRAASI